ncbi:hypothetical protein [uncultured Methanobrevibacter sp.]|uniref:hypothetical protein n=1 Tax=uncultured Methanobrevibacter sp. TaxID=253161 RepID=UPI002604E4E6
MDKKDFIVFKKQYGNIKHPKVKELSINQSGVTIYEKDTSTIINFVLPIEESLKAMKYFEEFNMGEEILFNISDTGDFECIFRGISSPQTEEDYSSFSIIVQEKLPIENQL